MSIIIGADLVPTESNVELFITGNIERLFGKSLLGLLTNADYRIFNLEVPFSKEKSPIKKCGPALCAPIDSINSYKMLNIDMLTLGNNHIMDQGENGFKTTIELLRNANIQVIGAGCDIKEASIPRIISFHGKKIGIYACCEHEFSIGTDDKAGANPYDPFLSNKHISKLKKECDYLIVLYHGGKEHYRYPTPQLQIAARNMVDSGADLIICQHSHCVGCYENYNNSIIVYGQGNFLFDQSVNECWETGILISLDENLRITYIPIVKRDNTVRLANDSDSADILNGFFSRTQEIQIEGFVERKYSEFCDTMISFYLLKFAGINKDSLLFRAINKLTRYRYEQWLIDRRYSEKKYLEILNYIECEAHREVIINALSKYRE